jgi:hypothetical protein
LKRDGTTKGAIDRMVTFAQFNELIGLPNIRELESRYSG